MSIHKKHTAVVIGLVVTFSLLAWQVFRLVGSDLGTSSAVSVKKSDKHPHKVINKAATPEPEKWKQSVSVSAQEKQYLQLASEIQKAKMQHQLLQQRVAIAEAEKKLALSHRQVVKLSPSGVDAVGRWPKSAVVGSELHLVYLAKVASGQWKATLQRGDQLLRVERGTDLGAGLHVAAIIDRGVWLQDGGGVRWLGFPGEPIPSGEAAAPKAGSPKRVLR
jgi:hypothetical protein